MRTSINKPHATIPLAVDVAVDDEVLRVRLLDGREVTCPVAWFPRLQRATPDELRSWRLIGRGVGIHFDALDEDVSVVELLRG